MLSINYRHQRKILIINYKVKPSMNKKPTQKSKQKRGVQVFSNFMLMKFRPKTTQASKKVIQSLKMNSIKNFTQRFRLGKQQQKDNALQALKHIQYLQLASKNSVILGDYNQLDMIDLQGLTHGFVDTFHYWSLCMKTPILDMKVNSKRQVILILSIKKLMLYSYSSIKREKNTPVLESTIELRQDVRFMQFCTTDSIALFHQSYFEIYSLNQSHYIQKKVQKKYNVDSTKFTIFAVPQSIDNTINVFMEEKFQKKSVFGLWCIQINLMSQNVQQHSPYKIYDIMTSMKGQLILQNYSKDVVFLTLGQQILVAKKGYMVDSVNLNIRLPEAYLTYLPNRKVLVQIERNVMQTYSFRLNMNVLPHRIELTLVDSMQIVKPRQNSRMIGLLPTFQSNYAIFYEQNSKMTTRGEIFYSFIVSYTVNIQRKINFILATDKPISELQPSQLQQKCDILRKIGMQDKQIYLQIWRRSAQSSVKDYQLLLSTRSYKSIKSEIENKLRKTKLSFKQVYKVEQSCLQILRKKINSQDCDQEDLQDYITCHFLKRKLDLHRGLEIANTQRLVQEEKIFFIDIQTYYHLKNMEAKQFVLQVIAQHLFSSKKNIEQIRLILFHFRFVYRFIYLQLLEEIFKLAKNQLITLLLDLPQLLPHDYEVNDIVKEGVWKDISIVQWQDSLYKQNLINIYNKQVVEQLMENVWFKRNWLTVHDVIPLATEQIKAKNKRNNSVEIFYFFIQKAIENIKEMQVLKMVLQHVEKAYGKFPQHLTNKVLLYSKIYEYYMKHCELSKLPKISLAHLLTYKDYNLFKLFFEFQKVRKNCVLKQIIPIYQQSVDNGLELFNLSLLNYFKTQGSEISHLKYLLNRINNQKKEFHADHERMYSVLVKAMQIKLKIGSQNDIPIDEVLIYIQNIPIAGSENKQMIRQLQIIQKISGQSSTFKNMRVNMSIREIIDKYEEVIQKLVDYQIAEYDLMKLNDKNDIIKKSYRIFAEIQSLKNNVYGQGYNQLAFFIFLTRLMQHQDKIPIVNELINDEYLNRYYYIDLSRIENVVRYMYKWKFSQNAAFVNNAQYIHTLLDLLADDNNFKQFALLQLKFAELLSCPNQLLTYPLSNQSRYPRLCQLEEIIKFVDQSALKRLNFQEIAGIMKKLQELSKVVFQESKANNISPSISSQKIQDYNLYEVVIKIMITRGMITDVVPLIRNSIKMTTHYDVITIFILIYAIIQELNGESKLLITKITSLLYSQPEYLLQIVEKVVGGQFTGLQLIKYLKHQYDKIKQKYINYDPQNLIFNIYFTHLSDQNGNSQAKRILVKNTLIKIKKIRSEFLHDFLFDFIYIILCYEPLAIAIFLKFVTLNKYKLIRSFISRLIQEQIFDQLKTLEVMRRASYYLLQSSKENADIYSIFRQYSGISLVQQFKYRSYQNLNQREKKYQKNMLAFQKKKQKMLELVRSQKFKKQYSFAEKPASIKQPIKNVESIKDQQPKQYIFSDSDDDYKLEEPGQAAPRKISKRDKNSKIYFDPMSQRKRFYKSSKAIITETSLEDTKVVNNFPIKRSVTFSPSIDKDFGDEIIKQSLQKGSRVSRKYFGTDVRSGYNKDQIQPDFLGILQNVIIDPESRKHLDEKRSRSNKQAYIKKIKSAEILPEIKGKLEKKYSSPSSINKKMLLTQSMDMEKAMLREDGLVSLGLSNRKSEEEKSQRHSNAGINGQTPNKKEALQEKLQVQQKTKKLLQMVLTEKRDVQKSKQELKNYQTANEIVVTQMEKQSPLKSLPQLKISNQNQDVQNILKKIYRTYNPNLQNEPYNLRALAAQKRQNANTFKKLLKKVIQEAYLKPQKSFQIAIKFIQQITKKYPECEIDAGYIETYERLAKYQAKYALDLPMEQMLPLQGLFLKKQDLFDSIKQNIFQVCTHQNLFKISKLISIGFKKNAYEQEIIAGYFSKAFTNFNSIKEADEQTLELQKIKALANKLAVRALIQKAQNCIKEIEDPEPKKKVLQMFVETIKLKGNAREARELASKFK